MRLSQIARLMLKWLGLGSFVLAGLLLVGGMVEVSEFGVGILVPIGLTALGVVVVGAVLIGLSSILHELAELRAAIKAREVEDDLPSAR